MPIATLSTTTISTASIATIWDTTLGQVNTLIQYVIPYTLPAILILGVLFMMYHFGRRFVGGIR